MFHGVGLVIPTMENTNELNLYSRVKRLSVTHKKKTPIGALSLVWISLSLVKETTPMTKN